jgi:regulator of nucleoside diphosphate kinase
MRPHILRPQIIVTQSEHRKLLMLAASSTGSAGPAADSLLAEMERAEVVPDGKLPPDVVGMGARVRYRSDRDEIVEVELVYPSGADVSKSRISVLTPVGAALIGLRTGQSITWESGDGKGNVLTVLLVVNVLARSGLALRLVSRQELPESRAVVPPAVSLPFGDDDDPGPSAA